MPLAGQARCQRRPVNEAVDPMLGPGCWGGGGRIQLPDQSGSSPVSQDETASARARVDHSRATACGYEIRSLLLFSRVDACQHLVPRT